MMTPTPAGEFKQRVQVLNPVVGAPNELGTPPATPTVVATVWAKVTPLSAAAVLANAENAVNVTHEVRLRYTPLVTPDSTLVLGTRTLDVVGMVDVEEAGRELRLTCNERQAT